jgi:anti-sigma regulatory factor (Ser/Thr protein kinase)
MQLDLACATNAPAVVRDALKTIGELDAVRDDVMLVASELVTNAVMHSGGSAAATIQVRAALTETDVVISVADPGLSGNLPRMQDADVLVAGGYGLRIINQLASEWGFEHNQGCRVWARLITRRPGFTGGEQDLALESGSGGAGGRQGAP